MTTLATRLLLIAFADPNAFHGGDGAQQDAPDRFEVARFAEHARTAEAAGFDALFKPDFLGFDPARQAVTARAGVEPLTLLAALSQHTDRVGLIVTESTSFTEPYNVARWLTSLDHLSGGRAAWNVVTSYNGESNFGDGSLGRLADRYRRADEFLEVTSRLWSGWEPDAVHHDGDRWVVDPSRISRTEHHGEHFHVHEPLDLRPGPQGSPVIVQAGASEEGKDFAARHAEIVFAAAPDIETGRAFRTDLRERAAAAGRLRDHLKVLPGLNVFIADTVEDARRIHRSQFSDENLLAYRAKVMREAPLLRLGELDLDEVVPPSAVPSVEELETAERRRSRGVLLRRFLDRPGITLREFLIDAYEFGHLLLVGDAAAIADEIVRWHRDGAADGFVLKAGNDFPRFAREVVPLLRQAGAVRDPEITDGTFREALRS